MRRRMLPGLLCLSLLACAGEDAAPEPCTPPDVSGLPAGEVSLPQHWGYAWTNTPHRLRRHGFESGADRARVHVVGGTWSTGEEAADTVDARVSQLALQARGVQAVTTSVTVELTGGVIEGATDRAARGLTEVVLDLPEAGLGLEWSAWLTGFHLDTLPSHVDGYTVQGMRVALGPAVREGSTMRVGVRGELHAGLVADREQGLEAYAARLTATVTLLGSSLLPEAWTETGSYELPGGLQPEQPVETESRSRTLAVTCAADAALWISGFSLQLGDGSDAWPGRYLRGFELGVGEPVWQRGPEGEGRLTFAPQLRFSNTGLATRETEVYWTLDLRALPLADPGVARESQTFSRTGATVGTVDLD